MPTTRRRVPRTSAELITEAAVIAWQARDYSTVAAELRLKLAPLPDLQRRLADALSFE